MTTIYGSEGSTVGRSSGKIAEHAKQASPPVKPAAFISKVATSSELDGQNSGRVAGHTEVEPDALATSSSLANPAKRVRKLRAKPVDVERLKADNQRVKEMRERMRRLRENAAD